MNQDDTQQTTEENQTSPHENVVETSSQLDETSDVTVENLKMTLARQQADYENFKKRVERDKLDMMFFLRADIITKILARVDDLERVMTSTPEQDRQTPVYQGIQAIYTSLIKDLEKMEVVAFISKGQKVDPDKHDVMTQSPGEEGVILEEFAKGYMLGDRVLRHAKVVVGNGVV